MLLLTILEMDEVLERLLTAPMEQASERLPTRTAPTECEVSVTVTVTIDLLDRVS